jgi:hypothetical protein
MNRTHDIPEAPDQTTCTRTANTTISTSNTPAAGNAAMDTSEGCVDRPPDDVRMTIERFDKVTVKHMLQETCKNRIQFLLDYSPSTDLVALVGPTGVGKTTIAERINEAIYEQYKGKMFAESNFVPVLWSTAIASGHRQFSWKELYRDALLALRDPFVDGGRAEPASVMITAHDRESATTARLRSRLEHELKVRGVRYWVIDEAQHLAMGGRSGAPEHQLDVLKSIAQRTGVKLILLGTYELVRHLPSSGQLARRSEVVPFHRYLPEDPEHMRQFAKVLISLFRILRVDFPSVQENMKMLYVGSIGCVGIAKDWIARAYGRSVQDGAPGITLEHLKRTRMSQRELQRIMLDIQSGEQDCSRGSEDGDESALERLIFRTPKRPSGQSGAAADESAAKHAPKKPKPKPGVRRPCRDKIGAPESDVLEVA